MTANLNKIGVIGAGAFGTALAQQASRTPNSLITIFTQQENKINSINQKHINPAFPTYRLNSNIKASSNISDVLLDSAFVLNCIPSKTFPSFEAKFHQTISKELQTPFVNCSKGMIFGKDCFLSEYFGEQVFPEKKQLYKVLSGPSFAKEILESHPTLVVLAGEDTDSNKKVQKLLSNEFFRIYTSTDVTGVEVAGTLKNVIALGSGMCEGMGYGYNTIAGLIVRGAKEIQDFGAIYGADKKTFMGLAGIGDLMLTGFGSLSRNRTCGVRLGKGETLEQIQKNFEGTIEAVSSIYPIMKKAKEHNLKLPVIESIYQILNNKLTPEQARDVLMKIELSDEYAQ